MKISEKEYHYLTSELGLQTKRLELLEEIFRSFPTGSVFGSRMNRISEKMREVLEAETFLFFLEQKDSLQKPLLCVVGKSARIVLKEQKSILSHAEVAIVKKRKMKGNRTFTPLLAEVRNWIAHPLVSGTVVFGYVIAFNKKGISNFSRNDSNFLSAFARHAMTVLENRELIYQSEKKIQELSILIRASELGNSTLELHVLLSRLIAEAKRLIGAQASSILLYNEKRKELDFYVASSKQIHVLKKMTVPIGEGIASWVFLNKKPVIINDVAKDSRFYEEVDKQTRFKTKSMIAVPLLAKDEVVGVIEVINKQSGDFNVNDILLLTAIASQTGMSIQNARLFRKTEKLLFNTISSLSQAIDAKDRYTRGHSDRVTEYSMMIAEGMGMSRDDVKNVRLAGILHDIGKIGINEKILLKQGKLSDEEWEIIKKHPLIGEKILEHIDEIREILPGIRNHHEHFNGEGYPDKKENDNIPLLGRIIAVADAYDAMISERPYKPAYSSDEAIKELRRCSGKQFDPGIVTIFIDQLKKKEMINSKESQ